MDDLKQNGIKIDGMAKVLRVERYTMKTIDPVDDFVAYRVHGKPKTAN